MSQRTGAPAPWRPAYPTDPLPGCSRSAPRRGADWPWALTTVCGGGPLRMAGAIKLVTDDAQHARRAIAVHLVVRNDGPTPARILSGGCGFFSVRLYRSATAFASGAAPAWQNTLRTVRYGPGPGQVITEECGFAGWSLDLLPGQTRAREVTQVPLQRMTGAVAPGRYVVALGYRLASEGRLRHVRAGCVTLGRRVALSLADSGCAEWSVRDLREALIAEAAMAERRRNEPGGRRGSWFEFQVEVTARLIDSVGSTRSVPYPRALRQAGVTDTVFAQFVVDSTGHVDAQTIQILNARYQAAAEAVQRAVASWRYRPAQRRARAVRQLVQMQVPVVP